MIPLRRRLEKIRSEQKLPWETLERDYLFSWILMAMSGHSELRSGLVFKGGSCLKKCYFGKYRFSEDLDFTKLDGAPADDALEAAIQQVCRQAERLLAPIGNVRLECSRYVEREAHPHGQEAFVIRAQLPWHSSPTTKIKIEVTQGETVLCTPEERALIHEYGDQAEGQILTYRLEEIVAEKLRAILQQLVKSDSRGWIRPRPRDYYDLWRILNTYDELFSTPDFLTLLRSKCAAKEVDFQGPESFFPEVMLLEVERSWSNWMRPLVDDLPDWPKVRDELRVLVERLLS